MQQNTPAMHDGRNDRMSAPTNTAGASKEFITDPRGVANQMERLLLQQRHTLALMLPQPEITTFSGETLLSF